MPDKAAATQAARHLAAKATSADSPESRFAAMVTLEAVEPEGTLDDPEVVLLAADNLAGDKLAVELDKAQEQVRELSNHK